MTIPSTKYVKALLANLFPDADITVTREPDGLHIEVYADSVSLHAGIAGRRSPLLWVLEGLAGQTRETAS